MISKHERRLISLASFVITLRGVTTGYALSTMPAWQAAFTVLGAVCALALFLAANLRISKDDEATNA